MPDPMKPVVLIYADPLLGPTMTFVLAPAEALQRFEPYFVGPRRLRAGGLKMPPGRALAINETPGALGKVRELPFRRFGFAPLYLRKVRRLSPALLHAHGGPAGLAALPLSGGLQIPQVTTFHGFDATARVMSPRYGNRDYLRRKKVLMRKSALFLAVSQFIRGRLLRQGFPEDKVLVHYTGVDTEFFRPDPAVTKDPVVLFVGGLHEGKGCEYAIGAMARVQSALPEVELVIIGDGPLRSNLERMAKEKLRRYRFLGVQPPEVVRHWMNRAKVFTVPSVTAKSGWMEAFGMVFAEAQAMCLPVASFSSGGIPEVVSHGETGLLARERDSEGLAYNIETLLREEVTLRRLGDAGRSRVRDLFDLRSRTKRLEELYRRVLGEKLSAAELSAATSNADHVH